MVGQPPVGSKRRFNPMNEARKLSWEACDEGGDKVKKYLWKIISSEKLVLGPFFLKIKFFQQFEEEEKRKRHLSRVAQMLHDRKWDTITPDEQKLMDVKSTDLPFIFITLDKIRNQVRFVNTCLKVFYKKWL